MGCKLPKNEQGANLPQSRKPGNDVFNRCQASRFHRHGARGYESCYGLSLLYHVAPHVGLQCLGYADAVGRLEVFEERRDDAGQGKG